MVKKMRSFFCMFLCIALTLTLVACGSDRDAAAPSAPAPQEESASAEPAENAVAYGTKRDDLHYVIVSINPEILMGIDDDGRVAFVENRNPDGAEVLESLLGDGNEEIYESVEAFMNSYLFVVVDQGYAEEESLAIRVAGLEGNESPEYMEQVAESITNAVPGGRIADRDVVVMVVDDPGEAGEGTWVPCPNCEYGIALCPYCHGEWENAELVSGGEVCPGCGGTGVITVTDTHTVRAYNGTPCRVCGDVGTVDDGLHGGKRAACGECMGYGATHSVGDTDPGAYNGDYGQYAFSDMEVVEEREEPCRACDGTGKGPEPVYGPCYHCSYGKILCPVCNGAGGHFE
jgi:hypothetical protein